jgi:aldose 1-epimerase
MIALTAGDFHLVLLPALGGSIARFDWRGLPLLRPGCGPTPLDTGCFPLVPFSNRIAHGAFTVAGRTIRIAPNFPGGGHPHPLHGFGWLTGWDVVAQAAQSATLRHRYSAGEWPWDYVAEQHFDLSREGLCHTLSVRNLSDQPMPAGLGFHPYFPKTAQTRYIGWHRGEWQTHDDNLPKALDMADHPVDWWHGKPVATRAVDTAYVGREGDLQLIWPEHRLTLTVRPSDNLRNTVVYTPVDADFLCVEPVSHTTDAINRPDESDGMVWLDKDQTLTAALHYGVG